MWLVVCLGCWGDAQVGPVPTFPVQGTVTFKGKPVVGADVGFFCREQNRSAFGRTDDKGEFRMTTFSSNDGAVAGQHVVTIMKFAEQTVTEQAGVEDEAYDPYAPSAPPPKLAEIPPKYAKQETSGLTAVVGPDTPNQFKFDLAL
jgi:hypothetical protein